MGGSRAAAFEVFGISGRPIVSVGARCAAHLPINNRARVLLTPLAYFNSRSSFVARCAGGRSFALRCCLFGK